MHPTAHEQAYKLLTQHGSDNNEKKRWFENGVTAVFGEGNYVERMDHMLDTIKWVGDPEYAADLVEAVVIVNRDEGHLILACNESIRERNKPHLFFPALIVGGLRAFFFNCASVDIYHKEFPGVVGSLLGDYTEHQDSLVAPMPKLVGQYSKLLASYLNPRHFTTEEVVRRSRALLGGLRRIYTDSSKPSHVSPLYLETAHKIFGTFEPNDQMDGLLTMMETRLRDDFAKTMTRGA